MIKRILVALDSDTDTPTATRYATELAHRFDAEVTGVAVVDTGSIEKGARGGGIGSMYLMEKVEASLTAEAREVAGGLLDRFRAAVVNAGVAYETRIQEGEPADRIVEDGKYADLLIIGREPHFYYAHPNETPITLGQVIKRVVGAVLVVPNRYREVKRVVVAFDSSAACVRSLRGFVHMQPFGTDVGVDIVNVHSKGGRAESQLELRQAQAYVQKHGFHVDIHSVVGVDASEEIVNCTKRFEADLLLVGAQFVTPLSKLAFGSTTASLLDSVAVPMWVEN